MSTKTRATLEDLYKVEGKAELVNGEIVDMPPAGVLPGWWRKNAVYIFCASRAGPYCSSVTLSIISPPFFSPWVIEGDHTRNGLK